MPTRSLVIQFPESFIEDACTSMAEMDVVRALLDRSRRGILFDDETSDRVRPLVLRLIEAQGLTRLALSGKFSICWSMRRLRKCWRA